MEDVQPRPQVPWRALPDLLAREEHEEGFRWEARRGAMKAAEVYDLLDKEIGTWFGERGFRKRRRSRLAYQRQLAGGYHTVWFQCDNRGWDDRTGSSFFANFSVSESTDVEAGRRRQERLNFFLTDEELQAARVLRDEVVARIPRPPDSYFEGLKVAFARSAPRLAELMITAVRRELEPETLPYSRNHDLRLRYWKPTDIARWARLMMPVFARATEQMNSWTI